jgi:hypothetical protein
MFSFQVFSLLNKAIKMESEVVSCTGWIAESLKAPSSTELWRCSSLIAIDTSDDVKLLDEGLCLHQKILPTVRTTELESKPNFKKN